LVWVVAVVAPEADFVGDVWRTQTVALTAAGAAVLAAVVLAFALASAVSRPIGSLIGFMRRVGDGDLGAKAAFGGTREFRQLADALNRMIEDLRDSLRLRHSLGVAMEVQQRLLPSGPPKVRGLDVAGHSTYCDETGGDYYDFLVLDKAAPNLVLIALGDVMGHGVAAALVMASVRSVLHDRAGAEDSLSALMSRLNRLMAADHQGERFMTMHLSLIDGDSRTMRWASAGHDPAIIYDSTKGQFEETGRGGLPLGIVDEADYTDTIAGPFKPGQVIMIGTDGVWEMPNESGEQFGKERLREAIRESASGSAAEISTAIRKRLAKFQGTAKQVDDVTFVVVKIVADQTS
jgi:sigma-B regulation protein RsbU (phosphoserine phosphatase)